MTHLYTEFQFKMSICNGDNEPKSKGITLTKIDHLSDIHNCICNKNDLLLAGLQ